MLIARVLSFQPLSCECLLFESRAARYVAVVLVTQLRFSDAQIDVFARSVSERILSFEECNALRVFVLGAEVGTKLRPSNVAMLTDAALGLNPIAEKAQAKEGGAGRGRSSRGYNA